MFYKKTNGQKLQCLLCPRECVISDGKRGFCRNRENQNGKLYTIVYGNPSVVDIGPIEKAPIYHFFPGISDYVSPVPVVISDASIVKTGISPKKVSKN
jgi:pyruvate formate lyase activating enzyme